MYMYMYMYRDREKTTGHTHLDLGGIGIAAQCDGHRELFHEYGQRAQLAWEHKVEE